MLQSILARRAGAARELASSLPRFGSHLRPRAIVAVPICDEEERLESCVQALLNQMDALGGALPANFYAVLLLLNNCRDGSGALARGLVARGSRPAAVMQVDLAPSESNAGFARGLALDLAGLWLDPEERRRGILLTTDADSRVSPQWLAQNVAAIDAGCAAVAGRVTLEPSEEALLPAALLRRGAIEAGYESALQELSALIDPIAHDPWPNHWGASGASYALTLDAYRSIGGLPPVASGEDHALAEALQRADLKIRHDPGVVVVTSARLRGRAQGGVADTMRSRCDNPQAPGDPMLEALPNALRRYAWRRRLREKHASGDLRSAPWQRLLDNAPDTASALVDETHFGTFWSKLEATSLSLSRTPLRPNEMQLHMARAHGLLSMSGRQRPWLLDAVEGCPRRPTSSKAGQAVETIMGATLARDIAHKRPECGDEPLGCLVAAHRIIRGARPMHHENDRARPCRGQDALGEARDVVGIEVINDFG